MNAFTALMLYCDTIYGSKSLLQMLPYLPKEAAGRARGEHFLAAFQAWLADAGRFTTTLPAGRQVFAIR